MLFNSLAFAIFLPIVFIVYWLIPNKNIRIQNICLLVASYFFYASWDSRFLFLLMFSTGLDYYTGLKMEESSNPLKLKFWFWLSVMVNLGFLGIFKYYNFFAGSFIDLGNTFGVKMDVWMVNVILPVGISFYTFHGLSYVIDIYNRKIKAERNIVDYALFVSFFPLLVAGPIERATHLLPQIKVRRNFDYHNAVNGLRQILWGVFKKVVIADNCAQFANACFNQPENYSGSSLLLGAIFFAFQIYGDFSGYSDIAIGTARLFGIELLRNFAFAYFSRDIAEFWRRWHISLSSWFRDYLYIPLGGNRKGLWYTLRNIFILFLVSGFWHGANWTFIIWGALNAVFMLPNILSINTAKNNEIVAKGNLFPSLREIASILFTFMLVVFAWVFFRAESLGKAYQYLKSVFSPSFFTIPHFEQNGKALVTMCFVFFMLLCEWLSREEQHALAILPVRCSKPVRWVLYASLIFFISMCMQTEETPFIYFQF